MATYTVQETDAVLGKGTYGKVFVVTNDNGDRFAKKIYIDNLCDINELDVMHRADHPNIMPISDTVIENGDISIIMPLADYTDLRKYIETKILTTSDIIRLMHGIIDGFRYMHNVLHVCHGDIKLLNIVVKDDTPIIIDFGFSRHKYSYHMRDRCGVMGFTSPKSFKCYLHKDNDINPVQSEIYGIGCIFYYCITKTSILDIDIDIVDDVYDALYNDYYDGDDEYYNKIAQDAYTQVEATLLDRIKIETDDDIVRVFDCIYNMTRYDKKDRYKTLDEVLSHPIFSGFDKINHIVRPIPNMDAISEYPSNYQLDEKERKRTFKLMCYVYCENYGLNLYRLCNAVMLFMRSYSLVVDKKTSSTLMYVCVYLSLCLYSCRDDNIKKLAKRFCNVTESEFDDMYYKVLNHNNYIVYTPSICYDTKNASLIIWWLLMSCNDYKYITKQLDELNCEFSAFDYPELNVDSIGYIKFNDAAEFIVSIKGNIKQYKFACSTDGKVAVDLIV